MSKQLSNPGQSGTIAELSSKRRAKIHSFFLQLVDHALKTNSKSASLVAEEPGLTVHLFAKPQPGEPGDATSSHRFEHSEIESLATYVQSLARFWPATGGSPAGPAKIRSIRFAPDEGRSVEVGITAVSDKGHVKKINLLNINTNDIEAISETITLNTSNSIVLPDSLAASSGIILANSDDEKRHLDGCCVISALRRDAVLLEKPPTIACLREAIETAEKTLVILPVASKDPVEALINVCSLASKNKETLAKLVEQLRLSFIHAQAKRVCSNCAKSTPIDPTNNEKLPEALRPDRSQTYMFGRGCEKCGHTAYDGVMGLESLVRIDESIKSLILEGASANEIAKQAYKKGTRSLLEDGLGKIYSGLTSFEAVFQVTSSVSPAMASAINELRVDDQPAQSEASFHQQAPIETAETEVPKTAAERSSKKSDDKKRVLIVEDDADQRAVLELVFRAEGYAVTGAFNGKEALKSLESAPVDVVVCDVMMPEMNGEEFLEALRGDKNYDDLPVLMLTAAGNTETEYRLLEAGADDYCQKNVQRKILIKRVERLLSRSEAKRANPVEHLLAD
ncbi:hypothetical protein BVY02_01210 [bacterium J17]|nr:hypothetical protein BVY02_01210 [bacterium J17]